MIKFIVTGITWGARIIAGIFGGGPIDDQLAGLGVALGNNIDAAPFRIIDDIAVLVPVDEQRRCRCLHRHTSQIYVVAAFYVHFAIGHYFRPRNCTSVCENNETTKF